MKNIIQRKLSLDTTYTLTDKRYVSLLDGCGCTCDNCGKLIANIATVSNGQKSYSIGFDCLDTILQNNAILSEIDLAEYASYKAGLSKVMKLIKRIKDVQTTCKTVTGLKFEKQTYQSDYHTFYWLHNGNNLSRDNDNVKVKGVTTEFIHRVINAYFVNLNVLIA